MKNKHIVESQEEYLIEAAGLKSFEELMEQIAKLPAEKQKEVEIFVQGFVLGHRQQMFNKNVECSSTTTNQKTALQG